MLTFFAGLFFLVVKLALGKFTLLTLMGGYVKEIANRTLLTNFLLPVVKHFLRALLTQTGCFVKMLFASAEVTLPASKVEHGPFVFALHAGVVFVLGVRGFYGAVFGVKFCGDFKHLQSVLFFRSASIVPVLGL